ncbi:armadillo-type protein [Pisolithus albus]|nr:armadillo-type protein [Pisolithus albus]
MVQTTDQSVEVLAPRNDGSEITLSSLLRANAHQEVVRALANPHALRNPRLKAALARGLRVLANSMAGVVGHSNGPICAHTWEHLAETKVALNFHFESSRMTNGTMNDTTQYECLDVYFPLLDDSSPQTSLSIAQLIGAAVLTDAHRTAIIEWLPPPERQKEVKNHGGWEKHDLIYQAANGKHGAWVLCHLIGMIQRKDVKTSLEAAVPALNVVLAHAKSRVTSVQLAASLCATHIIRAQGNHHPGHSDRTTALSVIQVVIRILSSPSEQPQNQIKACYTLCKLATLKAIAAISLFDKVIKREVADTYDLMPIIQACLTQKNVGVRCSACHCLHSLSRDTAVIRTNIMDSGAGMALYQMFKKEDEDVMLEDGLLPRLMQLFGLENKEIRVRAIKNLLVKSVSCMKVTTMQHLGWSHLAELANNSDPEIQEQAFAIQRNLTEDETGVSLVFEAMGDDTLANCLSVGLDSPHELVTRQTTYVLGNVANSSRSQQDHIFKHPNIFDGRHHCLADARPGARVPLVGCLLTLLRTNPRQKRDLIEAGFVSTLRHLCERTGGGTSVGGIGSLTTGTSPRWVGVTTRRSVKTCYGSTKNLLGTTWVFQTRYWYQYVDADTGDKGWETYHMKEKEQSDHCVSPVQITKPNRQLLLQLVLTSRSS